MSFGVSKTNEDVVVWVETANPSRGISITFYNKGLPLCQGCAKVGLYLIENISGNCIKVMICGSLKRFK